MGICWESDDSAVKTAILLEQTLKELDDRYKKAAELSMELLEELDERYKNSDRYFCRTSENARSAV